MRRTGYMPGKQAEQVSFSGNLANTISVDPVTWGVPAIMSTNFVALNASLQTAWATVQEPTTTTRVTVKQKNDLLKAMKVMAGKLVALIQASPSVSEEMLVAARLTVRRTHQTPQPAPAQKPIVVLTSIDGRLVRGELRQSLIERGKAPYASSATIFMHFGNTPPSGPEGWTFAMNTTKTKFTIPLPASEVSQKVWVTSFWSNRKDQSSPGATPVSIDVPAGGVLPSGVSRMKIAA